MATIKGTVKKKKNAHTVSCNALRTFAFEVPFVNSFSIPQIGNEFTLTQFFRTAMWNNSDELLLWRCAIYSLPEYARRSSELNTRPGTPQLAKRLYCCELKLKEKRKN